MKKNFKGSLILGVLICSFSMSFGQEHAFISRLKTQMLLYRTQNTDQSIVIQTDKTLYRPGETIWMKGYVSDAITHQLSLKSLELSVQLSDNKGVNLSEGNYPLKNGVADCNFPIPTDLHSDVYYLTAYTPEMECCGISAVFKKEIFIGRPEHFDMIPTLQYSKPFFAPESKEIATIRLKDFNGKPLAGKRYEYQLINENRELLSGKGKTAANGTGEIVFFTPAQHNGSPMMVSLDIASSNDRLNLVSKIPLSSEKLEVTFFPAGGRMVPGIHQKVAFEVKDQLGYPVNIKAVIIDEQENVVTSAETFLPGLGVFDILSMGDKKLSMKIVSDSGKNQLTLLPATSPGSLSLSVRKNDGKNLSVLLGRTPGSKPERYTMVAANNGEMIWASDFELEQAGGMINVPLDKFTSEFACLAVFTENGELVARHLIYTGRKKAVDVVATPDKGSYKKGEQGQIKVKVTGPDGKPLKAELSVSIADKFTFPASVANIENLKYGLQKPIPFTEPIDKVDPDQLNCFLATNQLKGFDWDRIMVTDASKTLNPNSGLIRISGTVLGPDDKVVPNALVSLTSSTLQQFNARSDQNGEFAINLPGLVDKNNLSASATDGSGKGNYRVKLNKSFQDELKNSLDNTAINSWPLLEQMFRSKYFNENPDFYKATPVSKARNEDKKTREPYWKKYLASTSSLLEIIKTIRTYELINGKIVFRGSNSFIAQDGAMIVIDGQKMGTDASALSMISPHDVEDIQILLNPVDMSRYTALNSVGIIEIKTKRGGSKQETTEASEKSPASTYESFKPKTIGNEKFDLKTTLQWIPVLFTDAKGEAVIPFKTGGIKSVFVLEIAGFTDQGQWIEHRSEIKVE